MKWVVKRPFSSSFYFQLINFVTFSVYNEYIYSMQSVT